MTDLSNQSRRKSGEQTREVEIIHSFPKIGGSINASISHSRIISHILMWHGAREGMVRSTYMEVITPSHHPAKHQLVIMEEIGCSI